MEKLMITARSTEAESLRMWAEECKARGLTQLKIGRERDACTIGYPSADCIGNIWIKAQDRRGNASFFEVAWVSPSEYERDKDLLQSLGLAKCWR